jgi:eukaryotic-like serine/threonine-protein kinase
MAQRILILGLLLLIVTASTTAQTASVAMSDGNAQRTRVLATQSVDTPPRQVLWQTERLFQLKRSTPFSSQVGGPGGIRISGDLPTGHTFTFPIVSQGIIFFTLYVDNAYFYAIDANTGKQIVTLKFDNNRLSSPAAIGQVAYFGASSGKVYAYDVPTRQMKWTYEGEGAFSASSPAIDDGVVYVAGPQGVVALSADTGTVKWTYKADQILYRPVIKGDHVVVYGLKGLLLSLDKKTGTKKWEAKLGREFGGTAILDDQVFVRHVHGEIRAYSLADGAVRWSAKKDGGAVTTLALFEDTVIYGEEYGNIAALDSRTGMAKWKFKTKKSCFSPIVAGETVYTSCGDHHLYAFDAQTGQLRWKYDGKRNGPLPTFYNGVMYFLSMDGTLQAMK